MGMCGLNVVFFVRKKNPFLRGFLRRKKTMEKAVR